MEPGAAVRADEPLGVDAIAADRAELVLLDLGKQRLLGQAALVDLGQRLARPDDQVQHDREQEEQRGEEDDEGGGEVRKDRVLGPGLHVPERPVRGAEPEQDHVDHDQLAGQLHDRVAQEPIPELADRFENRVHLPAWPLLRGGRRRSDAVGHASTHHARRPSGGRRGPRHSIRGRRHGDRVGQKRGNQQPVLLDQHPCRQRLRVVSGQHGDPGLGHDRPGVQVRR